MRDYGLTSRIFLDNRRSSPIMRKIELDARQKKEHAAKLALRNRIRRAKITKRRAAKRALERIRVSLCEKRAVREVICMLAVILPRARKASRPSRKTRDSKKMREYRDGIYFCEKCNSAPPVCTHHIIPFSSGGKDEPDNYAALCKDCHTDMHPENRKFLEANNYVYNFTA